MNNDLPAKTAQTWTPEGNRKRGRPRTTWRRTMEELKAAGLTWGTAARRPKTEGSGEILCESYVPHGTKRISK